MNAQQRPNLTGERAKYRRVVTAGVGVVALLVFFRHTWISGFDRLMGDEGDARFIALTREHWLSVVQGQQAWRDPDFFYPHKGSLGYSDGLFLDNLFYLPLRLAHVDVFLASQLTTMMLMLLSFYALVYLMHCQGHLNLTYALPLAIAAIFTNGLYLQSGHAQLYAICWLPIIALIAVEGGSATRGWIRIGSAFAVGLMLGLLFLTSFYIAWFAVFIVCLCIFASLCLLIIKRRPLRRTSRMLISANFLVGLIGFITGLIPFIATYLPTLDESGGRSLAEVTTFSPWISDMANSGSRNFVWGRILQAYSPDPARLSNIELTGAPTPVLLLLMVVLAYFVWKHRHRVDHVGHIGLVLTATALLVWIMPASNRGHSMWTAVWAVVPGAHAIRVPGRIWLVDNLLVVIAISALLSSLLQATKRSSPDRPFAPFVLILCLCWFTVLEQVNLVNNAQLDRSDNLALMAAVPPPPSRCDSFYVLDDQVRPSHITAELDAMLVADSAEIPTLNGFSGITPPGWDLYPSEPDYSARIRDWLAATHLSPDGVCEYNLTTHAWTIPEP